MCYFLNPVSPWYNRTGWLGVKHQLIYLLNHVLMKTTKYPLSHRRPSWSLSQPSSHSPLSWRHAVEFLQYPQVSLQSCPYRPSEHPVAQRRTFYIYVENCSHRQLKEAPSQKTLLSYVMTRIIGLCPSDEATNRVSSCIHMQNNDHIRTLKIQQSISEFGGLWKY